MLLKAKAVDPLMVVRRLEAADTPRPQAEALADVLREAERQSLADLATKADLALLRAELAAVEQRLNARIDPLEQRLNARIDQVAARVDQLEQRLTIKLGAMLAIAVGLVAALVRLL